MRNMKNKVTCRYKSYTIKTVKLDCSVKLKVHDSSLKEISEIIGTIMSALTLNI